MKQKCEKGREPVEKKEISSSTSVSCVLSFEQERLRDVLDNIPSAVIVLEKPDAKISFANKRAIELSSVNPCGLKLEDYARVLKIHKLDGTICPTKQLHSYRALFNEETVLNKSEVIYRADGKRLIVNVSAKPLCDKDGNVIAAVTIFDDVTERSETQKALQESEDRLKMAQRIAHVGNWEYCAKEDRAIWSDELFRMFGMKPQKYGPDTTEYVQHVYAEDREEVNKKMEQLLFKAKAFSKTSFDYRIVKSDGSIRTIHSERVVREIGEDGKPSRIVGVEQDVTERKQSEQQLEEYAKNLEHLIEERTKQLQNAERLAAIGQTAGMIGHDIRNPLQSIVGELFLVQQEVDASVEGRSKSAVQESLHIVGQQIDYINKIISDLQDYARPLKPEMLKIDLCKSVPQIISTVNVPGNIEVVHECEEKLLVKADITFLNRILVNLVTNAIQAMPQGGSVTVRAFGENGGVCVTVSDTGVGIPDEIKPKLFQPLMTTKAKGQGFGLAVVKRLVEAQGGTVSFESKVGEGTTFKVVFPKDMN